MNAMIVRGLVIAIPLSMAAAKIHPRTYQAGLREHGCIHAWIYFSHKPWSLDRGQEPYAVTQKALDRRQLRGSVPPPRARELDRPISADFIQQIKATGAAIRHASRWLNAVSVCATVEHLEAIALLSIVDRIEPVLRLTRQPLPKTEPPPIPRRIIQRGAHSLDYGPSFQQLDMMNVPAVHDLGYSGRGISVLMLDTGFFTGHEAIDPDRILAEYDFLDGDSLTHDETAQDSAAQQQNHGTYTYTALGGYSPGRLIGPAYKCSFLLAKTESAPDEFRAEEDNYVAGLEWGERLGADIVSSSLGYLYWYTFEDLDGRTAVTTRAVLWAARLGMLVVTAAGNQRNDPDPPGWEGYIIAPADADSIIAVGAVNSNGSLASFSSHGPTYDGRFKPELVALGINVVCANPAAPTQYTLKNGTSLATPLVTGSAALLLQAHPTWSPQDVRTALMNTASRAENPNNDYGWGIPDILAALNYNAGMPEISHSLEISKIYPNPFQPERTSQAMIKWSLGTRSSVNLDIYNLLGRHVASLYSRPAKAAGEYILTWAGIDKHGRSVPSGIYLVRLSTGTGAVVRRLTVQH